MIILRTYSELAKERKEISGKLAFVPTMGALHDGHLALVREAKKYAENVIVSIFVNPTQFGPNEDFSKYPRVPEQDIEKLRGFADYIYLPQVADIYPEGETQILRAGAAAEGLCGAFRPGHFDGVVTVVAKLFEQVQPDFVLFGEKDFQQLMVIREHGAWCIEHGKFFPEIIGVPTIRETDGLAMSSRNIYLTAEERKIAPKLYGTLNMGHGLWKIDPNHAQCTMLHALTKAGFKVQYLEQRWGRLLAAVYLGNTRLIDNVKLEN